MKLALPLALSAAAVAVPAVQEPPRFAPAPDSSVAKRFAETVTWEIESAAQTLAGQRNEAEIDRVVQELVRVVAVADTYLAPTGGPDGGPAKLGRVVEELSESAAFDFAAGGYEGVYTTVARSPLEGADLRVGWDADLERYVFTDAEGEESSDFDGLLEDLDLRALLPSSSVAAGGEWRVPVEAFVEALRAGGDWMLQPASPTPGEYSLESVLPEDVLATSLLRVGLAWDDADGEVVAHWTGSDEGLARVGLEVELVLSGDLAEAWAARIEASGFESDREDLELEVEWRVSGEGELVWDTAAGRFASFDLVLTGSGELEAGWLQPFGESSVEVGMEAELSVSAAFEARAEAE